MKLNPHTIALWLSIVGGVSGLYLRIHQQSIDDQRKRDALIEQVSYQNASIALLIQMLPDDKRQLMESIQNAQQRQLQHDIGKTMAKDVTAHGF